jgi:hypothetical protein
MRFEKQVLTSFHYKLGSFVKNQPIVMRPSALTVKALPLPSNGKLFSNQEIDEKKSDFEREIKI